MRLPLFPLGTVLVPSEVLPLHIFEPRYRALMDDLTGGGDGLPAFESEFGVVLIERGSEVGGGEVRRRTGTIAHLLEAARLPDGRWVVAVVGTRRFEVDEWLPDNPYPLAEVSEVDDTATWDSGDDERLADTERLVRRTLALATELGEVGGPVTFELSAEPRDALWQLCALAPIGAWDRQRLIEDRDPRSRLRHLAALVDETAGVLALRLARGQ